MKTIRFGSAGPDVTALQTALSAAGYQVSIDGSFGRGTEDAVKRFQLDRGLTSDGVVGRKTWGALLGSEVKSPFDGLTFQVVTDRAASIGHKVWSTPHRLWLFGIRSRNRTANSFDDILGCCVHGSSGEQIFYAWPGTTDPGSHWLQNPSRSAGTAILVAGQYLDTWAIDKHAGQYDALCQRNGEVIVYRDPTRDNKLDLDPSTVTKGYFGINLHAATQKPNGISTYVDKWSAGCQVHATDNGFDEMMRLAHEQVAKTGLKTFSYTLLDEWR